MAARSVPSRDELIEALVDISIELNDILRLGNRAESRWRLRIEKARKRIDALEERLNPDPIEYESSHIEV